MSSSCAHESGHRDVSLSVVIPTLHFDQHFRKAVASVLADIQHLDSADIIVVLDGPERDIPPWLGASGRVRVMFTGRREGSARALNLGIGASSARFIGRLDADDVWELGRADAQLQALCAEPSLVLVAGNGVVIDHTDRVVGGYPPPDNRDLKLQLLDRNPIIHSAVMFRRSAWSAIGGYDETLTRMQDYDLWLRLALHGELRYLPMSAVRYRSHKGQTSKHPAGVGHLLHRISSRRLMLARVLGRSLWRQHAANSLFVAAQLLRYARVRKPRYATMATAKPIAVEGITADAGWSGVREAVGRVCALLYFVRSRGRIKGSSFIIRPPASIRIHEGGTLLIGRHVMIAPGVRIVARAGLEVGDCAFIGKNATLVAFAPLRIGRGVLIGENVSIHTEDHGPPEARLEFRAASVEIGERAWLGAGVVVTKGVSIGDGATVGANAVVTRSVPSGELHGGIPARRLSAPDRGH